MATTGTLRNAHRNAKSKLPFKVWVRKNSNRMINRYDSFTFKIARLLGLKA